MHIITPYAPRVPGKPVIIVSTFFTSRTKETAVRFIEALHIWRPLDVSYISHGERWVVIQKHETEGGALEFHLNLTKDFIMSGSDEEWNKGWEPYLELWERYGKK